ncbi:BRCA1-associated RING domain protein 1-like [Rhynchophorus ferrugineus]|uniref:Uncharacterized protein n=1 Tax=Rhynchophorus ferrugineus TaxID=354439 RepID=A0A834MMR6_RHYFE|nr:hypothetical protein GWI33_022080 [Rhynchophorus ferrugineus]
MNLEDKILTFLNEFEDSLKCGICDENCKVAIRVKPCGHYFCQLCLKRHNSQCECPKCGSFYIADDLDENNIAKQCNSYLQECRALLENSPKDEQKRVLRQIQASIKRNISAKRASIRKTKQFGPHIIVTNNKKYCVNFTLVPTKKNPKGETPLHLACKRHKVDEVKRLLGQKVDINAKDYAGWAPLHEAIQSGNLKIVQLLLQEGCLVDIPGPDYTSPLHKAISLDNLDMVQILLSYGADPNVADYNGLKPVDMTSNFQIKKSLESYTLRPNENIFNVYISSDIYLYCHCIDNEYKDILILNKSIHLLNKMEVREKLTHIALKKTHKMSFKILQGMLLGLQFIEQESLKNYVDGDYFIDIPNYTFLENHEQLNNGIKKAMISSLLNLPKLFDGLSFHIEDHNIAVDVYHLKVDKEYLLRLIEAGGGQILLRAPALRTCEIENIHPFYAPLHSKTYWCCNYIIYPENKAPKLLYNMKELQHKTSRWLIDCIARFEICD